LWYNYKEQVITDKEKPKMKKVITIILAVIFSFGMNDYFSLSYAKDIKFPPSESEVKELIKNHIKTSNNLLVLSYILLDVQEIRTAGKPKNTIKYNKDSNTYKKLVKLPYESIIIFQCIDRKTKVVSRDGSDSVGFSICKDERGNLYIEGIDIDERCGDNNYGCFSGNCENGLGGEVLHDNEKQSYAIFVGTFKNNQKECGFETPCSGLCYSSNPKVEGSGLTKFHSYDKNVNCGNGEDLLTRLFSEKIINKKEYDNIMAFRARENRAEKKRSVEK
jgi:hypothetical protein